MGSTSEQALRPEAIWFCDPNNRHYAQDERGRSYGGPIWRKQWRKVSVIGETSKSWIIHPVWLGKTITRVSKTDIPHCFALTEADIDDREWVEVHRHAIGQQVSTLRDVATLREIAKMIGFQPRPR